MHVLWFCGSLVKDYCYQDRIEDKEKSSNSWTNCFISKLLSPAEAPTHPMRTFRSWPWYLQAEKDTSIMWYWKTRVSCGRSKADPAPKPSSEAHPLTLCSISMQPCPILAEGHQCITAGLVVMLPAGSKDGRLKTQWDTYENTTIGIIVGSGDFSITSGC